MSCAHRRSRSGRTATISSSSAAALVCWPSSSQASTRSSSARSRASVSRAATGTSRLAGELDERLALPQRKGRLDPRGGRRGSPSARSRCACRASAWKRSASIWSSAARSTYPGSWVTSTADGARAARPGLSSRRSWEMYAAATRSRQRAAPRATAGRSACRPGQRTPPPPPGWRAACAAAEDRAARLAVQLRPEGAQEAEPQLPGVRRIRWHFRHIKHHSPPYRQSSR